MDNIILTPGPVGMPQKIRSILSEQPMHHRSDEFKKIFLNLFNNLPSFFGTKNPVILQATTGTGAMESALLNTLSKEDRVLVINSGKFGSRWAQIARTLGLEVIELKIEWGKSFDTNQVVDNLRGVKAVLTQLTETSTGALHPVGELAKYTKDKDVLLMVDAISSLGAIKFEMDDNFVDVLLACSHKSFMSPPGISAISMSEKALNNKNDFSKYYLDLKSELESQKHGVTRFTALTSIIRSMDWALENVNKYNQIKRVKKISEAVRLIYSLGFSSFCEHQSPSVTVLLTPEGIDAAKLQAQLLDHKISVYSGHDHLKHKVIRVGHIGYIQDKDIIYFLKTLGKILNKNTEPIVEKAKKILNS